MPGGYIVPLLPGRRVLSRDSWGTSHMSGHLLRGAFSMCMY